MTLAGAPPPHGSWTETLEATKRLIDAQAPFDVVLLGCGSYGMPLTRYVWEKHNATASVYGMLVVVYNYYLELKANDGMMQMENCCTMNIGFDL